MDVLHISDSGVNPVKGQHKGANWGKGLPAMCVPIVLRLSRWQEKKNKNKRTPMHNDAFNNSVKQNRNVSDATSSRKVILNLKIRLFYLCHSFCIFDTIGCLINKDCTV